MTFLKTPAQSPINTPQKQTLHLPSVYSPPACLQTKIQRQTLLKVTLVTKQIKNEMCPASKLTWTYSKRAKAGAHNWNTRGGKIKLSISCCPLTQYLLAHVSEQQDTHFMSP